ncbi:integrase, catalytic region, zinc finger, CCHC-type containing protein, partial [Tanacetum coccineum]
MFEQGACSSRVVIAVVDWQIWRTDLCGKVFSCGKGWFYVWRSAGGEGGLVWLYGFGVAVVRGVSGWLELKLFRRWSGGGSGVKEKSLNRNPMNTSLGIGVSTKSNDTMNEETPVDVASVVKEGVIPSIDENLLKEDVSTIPVWVKLHGVPVTAFSEDGLNAITTKLGTPLMLDSYTSDICMQSWFFRHIHDECPKNTGAGEKKTVEESLVKLLECLNKALDEGPYQFQMFVPSDSTVPKLQTIEDLQGDVLLHHDAEIELMNLILLSIPNEIYNSMDACTTAKEMWKIVERLMRGTIQNQVDRETRFTNEFDQFVAEPGEALVSVYNRFAQLMNLNSLQPEWLKYVTQVCLAKRLTVDTFDDLFNYLQQFKKLVNASRAKKLEKSYDPLALVAHTGSFSRNTSSYYVTHPTSVVDYDDEYQQDDVQT